LEKTQTASDAEQKVKDLEAKVVEQKALIVKLEDDILKVLRFCLSELLSSGFCISFQSCFSVEPFLERICSFVVAFSF
jgi:hypothetical protein